MRAAIHGQTGTARIFSSSAWPYITGQNGTTNIGKFMNGRFVISAHEEGGIPPSQTNRLNPPAIRGYGSKGQHPSQDIAKIAISEQDYPLRAACHRSEER